MQPTTASWSDKKTWNALSAMSNLKNCKKLEETITTIGYTRKQANKQWFDEECAEVNEEKNAAREQAIQNNTR
jgi:hypothetical protein